MKKALLLLPLVLIACSGKQAPSLSTQKESPAATLPAEVIVNTSADLPEVRPVDDEWSEYINHLLGISVRFPKIVLEDMAYKADAENPTVEVHVIQQGEVVTFARDRNPTIGYAIAADTPFVQTDRTVRHPYYSSAYLEDPAYPYQIYLAKAETIDDLRAFIQRAYGKGCMVDEAAASRYDDRPGVLTFTVGPAGETCPGSYPAGDVVTWYQDKKVAVGVQPGWQGKFAKPFAVKSGDDAAYSINAVLTTR